MKNKEYYRFLKDAYLESRPGGLKVFNNKRSIASIEMPKVEEIDHYYCTELLQRFAKWLEAECAPPLTASEKATLELLPNEYKYIARDMIGSLAVYTKQPEYIPSQEAWIGEGWESMSPFGDSFQRVRPGECWPISELLGESE